MRVAWYSDESIWAASFLFIGLYGAKEKCAWDIVRDHVNLLPVVLFILLKL